jgi:RNA polymerase sigma factor (sigma-70 family)
MEETSNLLVLIKDLKRQSLHAQHELYKRYYGLFMSICMRYAGSQPDAEEILHDGFLKIFRQINQFKGEGSFEGWMKRIMVRTAVDYTRSKAAKQQQATLYVGETKNTEEGNHSMDNYVAPVENGVEQRLEQQQLTKMLYELTEQQRTVFNLFVMEGYGHKEIAQFLNISERSSQLYLQQARQALTHLLQTTYKGLFTKI